MPGHLNQLHLEDLQTEDRTLAYECMEVGEMRKRTVPGNIVTGIVPTSDDSISAEGLKGLENEAKGSQTVVTYIGNVQTEDGIEYRDQSRISKPIQDQGSIPSRIGRALTKQNIQGDGDYASIRAIKPTLSDPLEYAASPETTEGYELYVQNEYTDVNHGKKGAGLPAGLLLFPSERAQAVELLKYASSVHSKETPPSAVIDLVQMKAAEMGIQTREHPYV